ncbi:hypothetical protein [Mesorhizobium sp. B2-4-11]|uniref:hypothetical protein n=1 Tax=Mesorhizobium sp. B2-4-11 TaxID=2589938 RepID=UPI00112ED164|nr:hypothetical protein [Mesorhizobium sp. B2-4-11]TPL08677.1 hypothetical protein FJ944_17345 [Mesorhizobium sp. B2-4-11]
MFEITRDDIAELNDVDLRTLVALLCEATLRRANLPVSAATWGGDQTAKDGGLDVRVALPSGTKTEGFIPRAATGFQVKKPDMQPAEIPKEMKPRGVVRPVIKELAVAGGAYIIVSSSGSTADSALTSRKDAMAGAVNGIADAGKLHLDFYDRNRVASWVRDHPGLIPWVRSRIGKSVPGWKSYGGWSNVPASADKSYLIDDKARIKTGGKDDGDGLTAVDGINRIRDALRNPGQVVRLVGLSGVGKTRLVEALFDNAIGANALDPSLAIYTDVADGPDPQPKGLASDLIAAGTHAILVIDNCPPETHRHLSEVVRASGSTVSVITVEYDIREDQPEGTDVFSLETSSLPLIEKLLASRFPDLSQPDSRQIAEFSGGNARIALALAGTVKKSETVSGLTDTELFKRLFQQRHGHDAGLLQIAEACALVYSFEGEALAGDKAELPILGGLVGKTAQDVFTAAAELKRRDLLQKRAEWRAILPHAIANRLAALALQNIPYLVIEAAIVHGPSERLLRSFSRRLGYLDASKEAQAIVRGWLAPDGLLADVLNLNDLGRAMFENVAPVQPEATLAALENVFANADNDTLLRGAHFIRLLHALAYDAALFERAVALLCRFASLRDNTVSGDAEKAVAPLFYIAFSATHAPLSMRLKVTNGLLKSDRPHEQNLGIKALDAMMKSGQFMPYSSSEFGARSRDYGYYPKLGTEVGHWFEQVLMAAEPFSLQESPVMLRVQRAIARKFRGLWMNGSRFDALERICKAIAGYGFWPEGWIAARQTRQFGRKVLEGEALQRLTALEEFLRPKDLADNVRGIVLGERGGSLNDLEDDDEVDIAERQKRVAAAVVEFGKEVATDEKVFAALLPELIGGHGRLFELGRGLALGAGAPQVMWKALRAQVASTEKPNVQLLRGFLSGLQTKDPAITQALLDEAIDDSTLGKWLVDLQTSVPIDEAGVGRLRRALELGKASINDFFSLVGGRVCEPIPGPAFRDLILAIGAKPGGNPIALEILLMRLHSDGNAERKPLPETVEAGRVLLSQYMFEPDSDRSDRSDYTLGVVTRSCLKGQEGAPIARKMWHALKTAIEKHDVYAWDLDDLLRALFTAQPATMLDELIAGSDKDRAVNIDIIQQSMHNHPNPASAVPDDVILEWCKAAPPLGYPFAATLALLFNRSEDKAALEWRPLAKTLLERSPDPVAVFKAMSQSLWPMSFEGSIATEYETRLQLLDRLEIGPDAALAAAVAEMRAKLAATAAKERRAELEEDRAESGRFE